MVYVLVTVCINAIIRKNQSFILLSLLLLHVQRRITKKEHNQFVLMYVQSIQLPSIDVIIDNGIVRNTKHFLMNFVNVGYFGAPMFIVIETKNSTKTYVV